MKEIKFEDALHRLEEIVKELEEGDVSLDDALKLFEEGQGLLLFLRQKLNRAEVKIKELTKTDEGFLLKDAVETKETG
ncbi:MAG: exodeoxyribonuclease VII small subunit [bacterium (Candidatus Stahlbacteria) CG08_land_8_20_14_0_20_40_26]|nr:MAG: exodeoxyribonuclease VII small subunit [bacterium (Candidatus Stahlbacteria) CG23_combo_of_CG06-09_8_20_14_all_40_9]PIS25892.1 MAG: exodeoxyribonuclease VII small subunit [bacterium (Candidatus Stahlbacteria) CG08_land_8_20_14_0_20_40_26]